MYCLSVNNPDIAKTIQAIHDFEMAEIRLDLCHFDKKEIGQLCEEHQNLIFTFRPHPKTSDQERKDFLLHAMDAGAAWVDLDIDQDKDMIEDIKSNMSGNGKGKLILSYHNFERVPTNQELYEVMIRAGSHEPDLIKLACFSHGHRDNKRLIPFNESFSNVIAFNMGEKGRFTRILCLLAGAPFTYVCLPGQKTAPGQMDRQSMENILDKYYKK